MEGTHLLIMQLQYVGNVRPWIKNEKCLNWEWDHLLQYFFSEGDSESNKTSAKLIKRDHSASQNLAYMSNLLFFCLFPPGDLAEGHTFLASFLTARKIWVGQLYFSPFFPLCLSFTDKQSQDWAIFPPEGSALPIQNQQGCN